MYQEFLLPPELESTLGNEKRDFAIKARRANPLSTGISFITFGIIWFVFLIGFSWVFLTDKPTEEKVILEGINQIVVNGESDVSLLFPNAILGILGLIGIMIILSGIVSIMKQGGYFVGTPKRLVAFRKQSLTSTGWEEFTNNLEIKGNNIILELKSGFVTRSSNTGKEHFVHNRIFISGIDNAQEIGEIIRKNIASQAIEKQSPTS